MTDNLGNVLVIANPAAQNGRGAEAAKRVRRNLECVLGSRLTVQLTENARHAEQLAEHACHYDTVVAVGGDGVIHEVGNGLMRCAGAHKPALGIIPVGSGNDYARTLGMSFNVDEACNQLLRCMPRPADVGTVNGEYFLETLSFGLDAAIALDTIERRVRTGKSGTALYMASGFDQLFHHLDTFNYTASFNGDAPVMGQSITFAVQIGPYYGGGFKVCPDARINDGQFSLCIAHPPIGVAKAAFVFLLAKDGHHTRFKPIDIFKARSVHVEFETEPPAQIDGERIVGFNFDIEMCPGALQVLMPVE